MGKKQQRAAVKFLRGIYGLLADEFDAEDGMNLTVDDVREGWDVPVAGRAPLLDVVHGKGAAVTEFPVTVGEDDGQDAEPLAQWEIDLLRERDDLLRADAWDEGHAANMCDVNPYRRVEK